MDLKLDKEHLLLQQMYRAFAENEVEPVAADVDATEEVPMENVKKWPDTVSLEYHFLKNTVDKVLTT